MPALLEESLSVDGIERVGEIDLDEHGVRVGSFALAPLPRSLQTHFGAERLRNADLERPKKFASLVLVRSA